MLLRSLTQPFPTRHTLCLSTQCVTAPWLWLVWALVLPFRVHLLCCKWLMKATLAVYQRILTIAFTSLYKTGALALRCSLWVARMAMLPTWRRGWRVLCSLGAWICNQASRHHTGLVSTGHHTGP